MEEERKIEEEKGGGVWIEERVKDGEGGILIEWKGIGKENKRGNDKERMD